MSAPPPDVGHAAGSELLQRYYRELRARSFGSDAAQLTAIARLDDLRTRLIAAPSGGPA